LRLTNAENIIYFLSGGDPTQIKLLRETILDDVFQYYYLRRVEQLNQIYENIAHAQHLEELEKKK